MRCEICGAPIIGDNGKRCERCKQHRSFSAVPPAPLQQDQDGDLYSLPEKTTGTQKHIKKELRRRSIDSDDSDNFDDKRGVLPLPDGAKGSVSLPSSVILEGKYRLLDELGRGSMGTVFLAEDTALKRKVAVKFLLPELTDSSECAHRFRQEAVAMASIRNENVAQIYAFGEDKGTPYFVMEYLDGETVEHLIDSHNRRGFYIPVDDVVDIMVQALTGLRAIHKANAVHRDIKPANIMLTVEPMRSIIMDFGLVRDVQVEDDVRTLAGTPAYIAPELVEGKPGADRSPLTDIYSLGITFYELLTGSIPFGGKSWIEILQKHITEIPVYPSTRRPGIPEILDNIVMRAISKEPNERHLDCDEFLEELWEVQKMPLSHERRISIPPTQSNEIISSSAKRSPSRGRISNVDETRGFRSTPSGTRGRLLVVDTDPEFRRLVHTTAKSTVPGCRVHSATDGNMALDLVETICPHLLLIDLSLPELNGMEVVATLRGDERWRQMQIIVVSGNGGKREAAILSNMNVIAFLTKPIDQEELADLLRPLLERPMSVSNNLSSYF